MKILALDQATRTTGYAIFDDNQLVASGTFSFADDNIALRVHKIRNKVKDMILSNNIQYVLLENIQMQGQANNVETFKKLAYVLGILEELCVDLGVTHEVVGASTWRSVLGIKGATRSPQKANAQKYVLEHYNKKVSEDESDAICIGAYYLKHEKSAF